MGDVSRDTAGNAAARNSYPLVSIEFLGFAASGRAP